MSSADTRSKMTSLALAALDRATSKAPRVPLSNTDPAEPAKHYIDPVNYGVGDEEAKQIAYHKDAYGHVIPHEDYIRPQIIRHLRYATSECVDAMDGVEWDDTEAMDHAVRLHSMFAAHAADIASLLRSGRRMGEAVGWFRQVWDAASAEFDDIDRRCFITWRMLLEFLGGIPFDQVIQNMRTERELAAGSAVSDAINN